MSEVSVLFQGMILWWAASNPAVVLVPDLTAAQAPHRATISAPASAFAGGACPARFDHTGNTCFFVLDHAGNAGGVQIELLSNTAAPTPLTPDSMCAVPPLQHTANDPLVLRPAYTPPSGAGNTAWMSVLGGTGEAVMAECEHHRDCPRYGKWTVTAAGNSDVVLVLKNLKNGAPPLLALLNGGAELIVANVPVPTVLHQRLEKRRAGSKEKEEPLMTDAAEDWCSYFSMVALQSKSNTVEATPCPGKPRIPECPEPELVQTARLQGHGHGHGIQTIACSSSQYP
ncbi:MAG TPA: hypothetical protein VEK57_25440 [Thermoanaerobaculia bacterium]|nr:hypothetical protein [Thermoanaerobaculia bacterium]